MTEFNIVNGVLKCGDRICVPDINGPRQRILHEVHYAPYSVKFERQKPTGLLQELPLPEWKWERITMDFVIGLPRMPKGHDSIWVIVDRLTKSAHFIAIKTTYNAAQLAQLYVDIIVKYHGVPVSILEGTDLIQETSAKVPLIQERLRMAFSRQKSYADSKRRDVQYEPGDQVFLKVSPMKGVVRFGKRGKLNPIYIGPFEILERVGNVSYRLALPPHLSYVHPVFHISMLRKYIPDPSHVLQTPEVNIAENLSYEEIPVAIIDRQIRKLRNKEITMIKVQWQNQRIEECIWETKESMRTRYP
ncbi:hypothetical protein K2173_018753 [Erythroxylum novogranatense]|uniref:Tf2-1-like SH3-like domain-containing protein n=1 Tax=Erythroxylum novogranatense TaxID=1862640 RepID=A0AAV8SB51_9ROSI|nr:hypothetical protein K2173_018753 [Erythroxylum novogranatense]